MTINKPNSPDQPKDGFDFIEYPCEYLFKAMCRVDKSSPQSAEDAIHGLVLKHVEASRITSVYSNQSRTGKFVSISLKVQLHDRAELEAIYKTISESPLVVMTL